MSCLMENQIFGRNIQFSGIENPTLHHTYHTRIIRSMTTYEAYIIDLYFPPSNV
jgi:hypothetical protein